MSFYSSNIKIYLMEYLLLNSVINIGKSEVLFVKAILIDLGKFFKGKFAKKNLF